MEGLQIATYNNRVIEIVPDYRLKETSDGTITITKDSVEQATYAPFSENDQTEGMYIQNYSINEEGHPEKEWYEQNQLVAIVDLNYRFLTPINPKSDDPDSPEDKTTSHIISDNGCVEIDNKDNTINRGDTYTARLTTKEGFARLPKGRIEMQVGNDGGEDDWVIKDSWLNGETQFDINIPNVTGNLRFVFEEECVYNLTIKRTLNGQPWPNCPIGETEEPIEKHCSDIIDTDSKEIKKPITNYLINSVTPSEITTCTNTTITVDYKPANSPLVLTWYDTTEKRALHANDSLSIPSGEVWDEEALNVERQKITIDPKVYEYEGMSPTSVAGDGSPKAVVFKYHKIPYTVTYNVGDHVHMENSSTQSTYYNGEVSERTYTIDEGFTLNSSYTPDNAATVTIENGTINVTNITDNITIYLGAASTIESIFASQIDAMGGVRLTAKYTDGHKEAISDNITVESYQTGSNITSVDSEKVEKVEDVYDYDFTDYDETATTSTKLVNKGPKKLTKIRIPELETAKTGTAGKLSNIKLNVKYNGQSYTTNPTERRAETYGYYSADGFEAGSDSDKLLEIGSDNWKDNKYLADFGDSCNMYGASTQGSDIYNKDVTPYYIPGTDIGENPLKHVNGDVVTFTGSLKDYNTNGDHNDHYHISWNPDYAKYIFDSDKLLTTLSYCGDKVDDCGCKDHTSSGYSDKTVEAKSKDGNVIKQGTVKYSISYVQPNHNYGRDSISYYHANSNYRAEIDNSTFYKYEEEEWNPNVFSYPYHIKLGSSPANNSQANYNDGKTSIETVRWNNDLNYTIKTPDGYSEYYYDYNNKIINEVTGRDYDITKVTFDPYNKNITAGYSNITLQDGDLGRSIVAYYSRMSDETKVRPDTENKFYKLNPKYSSVNYTSISNGGTTLTPDQYITSLTASDYIAKANENTEVKYIPENANRYEPKSGIIYPYDYNHLNIDLQKKITETGYEDATAKESEILNHKHCYYNLKDWLTYEQYYNGTENHVDVNKQDHYLYNTSTNKYVACVSGFKQDQFEIVSPRGETTIIWWQNNHNNITSIKRGPAGYVTRPITEMTVVDSSNNETTYSENELDLRTSQYYYPSQEVDFGPIANTNADRVNISFESCNDSIQGIGSFAVNGVYYDYNQTAQILNPGNGSNIEISIKVNTNITETITQEGGSTIKQPVNINISDYINNSDKPYSDYENQVFTGGGRFVIEAVWGSEDNADTRIIYVPFSGSCTSEDNPDKTGNDTFNTEKLKLTWEYLYNNYNKNDYVTPFDNKYNNEVLRLKEKSNATT